ncbi:MAG TPA: hypothetical protein VGL39_07345 [Jatrophihabitantaceae bacterium]|jgi:hypothetical protein
MAQLELLQASHLDWSVITPPPLILTDTDVADGYRIGDQHLLEGAGDSFSFADLARAVLDEIEQPHHRRQQFLV